MKWLPLVAVLILSGCVTAETSSTTPIQPPHEDMQTAEEAMKEVFPDWIPAKFICKSRESIIKFVNVDMYKDGRIPQQQNAEFKALGSMDDDCLMLPRVFHFIPTERVLKYTDQQGIKSTAWQVQFGNDVGYVVAIDVKQNMGMPI